MMKWASTLCLNAKVESSMAFLYRGKCHTFKEAKLVTFVIVMRLSVAECGVYH